jgi:copper chaperone
MEISVVTFNVEDMTCDGCAASIKRAVAKVDEEARIDVDVCGRRVAILGSAVDPVMLAEAIRAAGFSPKKIA